MARRGVRLTILCEDVEHQRFAYHVFLNLRFSRHELRFEVAPSGRGAADQWVRKRYSHEVKAYRRRFQSQRVGLVVLIDADRLSVDERHRQLDDALTDAGMPCRDTSDVIVIFVPKRHIETWIAYLLDYGADEEQAYKNTVRDADIRQPAQRFVELFRLQREQRPDNLLPALERALDEMRRIPE